MRLAEDVDELNLLMSDPGRVEIRNDLAGAAGVMSPAGAHQILVAQQFEAPGLSLWCALLVVQDHVPENRASSGRICLQCDAKLDLPIGWEWSRWRELLRAARLVTNRYAHVGEGEIRDVLVESIGDA